MILAIISFFSSFSAVVGTLTKQIAFRTFSFPNTIGLSAKKNLEININEYSVKFEEEGLPPIRL